MVTCKADPAAPRLVLGNFQFPLGVYPVEPVTPVPGYTVAFEPADGDEAEGELEEWPDRYMFDIVISAERLEPLLRSLLAMAPFRVFPILDILGQDAFRETDPYVSYDLVGLDRFVDTVRRFRAFFFEDGVCGFGVMSEEPFYYLFVDEHKIATIRVEPQTKERVERVLRAFDLEAIEEPAGADAAAHEHRSVLVTPADEPGLLGVEEIVERLRDEWRLVLNVDSEGNDDQDGKALGVTGWRCVVRFETGTGDGPGTGRRYAEVFLAAPCLREAEELALEAVADTADTQDAPSSGENSWGEADVIFSDRLTPERLQESLTPEEAQQISNPLSVKVFRVRMMET